MSSDAKNEMCCPNCGTTMKMKETTDAAYPWNQCVTDQLKRGYSQEDAKRICGEIKAKSHG